jgi:hypothetical protein
MKDSIEYMDNLEQQEQEGGGFFGLLSNKKKTAPNPPPLVGYKNLPSVVERKKKEQEEKWQNRKELFVNKPIKMANTLATTLKSTPRGITTLTKKVKNAAKPFYKAQPRQDQLQDLTKDLSQEEYNKAIRLFPRKFNEYLEKFLNSADSQELVLQRQRIIQLLSQIRAKDVQINAANMFTYLAGLNKNILAQSSDYEREPVSFSDFNKSYNNNNIDIVKLITDSIYSNHVANVFNDNNKEKAKKFFLELLIIHYYPTIILYIIHENMKTYINIIKTTRDKIINTEDSPIKTMIDSLLSNAGDDDSRAEAASERVEAGHEEEEAVNDDDAFRIGGVASMRGGAFELAILKNYNNNANKNPYLNSSGTMFYNALINFAVSISINDKDAIKSKMLNCLKQILIEQFNIITDGNFSNQQELEEAEKQFADIKNKLESDVNGNGTAYIKAYNESKQYKKKLEDLIKTEKDSTTNIENYRNEKDELEGKLSKSDGIIRLGEANPTIQDFIAIYKSLEARLEYFKDYFAKSEETRKEINTLLIYMFALDIGDEETASASSLSASASVSSPALAPPALAPASVSSPASTTLIQNLRGSNRVAPAPLALDSAPPALDSAPLAPASTTLIQNLRGSNRVAPAPLALDSAPPAPDSEPPALDSAPLAPDSEPPALESESPALDSDPPALAPPALAPPALAPPALAPPALALDSAPPALALDSDPPALESEPPALESLRQRLDKVNAQNIISRERLHQLQAPSSRIGGSPDDDTYCYSLMYNTPYTFVIENSIVKGIGWSSMFTFLQQPAYVTEQVDTTLTAAQRVGGKGRTRRYKKQAGTRRQKKRRGTHRKQKNTTR